MQLKFHALKSTSLCQYTGTSTSNTPPSYCYKLQKLLLAIRVLKLFIERGHRFNAWFSSPVSGMFVLIKQLQLHHSSTIYVVRRPSIQPTISTLRACCRLDTLRLTRSAFNLNAQCISRAEYESFIVMLTCTKNFRIMTCRSVRFFCFCFCWA